MKTNIALVCVALATIAVPAFADEKAECIGASEKAQQLRDEHKLKSAREQFLVCAKDACPAAVKKDCSDQMTEMDKKIPSVVVRAKGKDGQDLVAVKVTSDGVTLTEQLDGHAIPLDPGVHNFHFEAAGNDPFDQQIVLAEGERDRAVVANFGKHDAGGGGHKGAPIGAFIVGGIGLVAMGIAPIFYAMGLGEKSDIETGKQTCVVADCNNEKGDIRSKLAVGDIFMFGGAAVLAAGIIWTIVHYTSGSKEASNPAAARFDIAPTMLGHGAVASTTIRW